MAQSPQVISKDPDSYIIQWGGLLYPLYDFIISLYKFISNAPFNKASMRATGITVQRRLGRARCRNAETWRRNA